MKRKTLLFTLAAVGAVAIAAVAGAGYWISGPMYSPGMVRDSQDLSAPLTATSQDDEAALWPMEPRIALAHFAAGEGRPVLVIHGGPGIPFVEPLKGLGPLENAFRFH